MRILLINWQDRLNPQAGGAEVHLHEIFGRLAARGHRVTLLVSGWQTSRAHEVVDGLEVYRVGRRYTFGVLAPQAGRALLARERYDLVVEALNKVPTFSPMWANAPVVLLVHHLFGLSAFQEAAFPLAAATWLFERPLPWVYRGLPVQAISQSTADDLVVRGIEAGRIQVIHPGVDLDFYSPPGVPRRAELPTFLYVGRLRRYKRVDLILRAVALLHARGTTVELVVAGRGAWEPHLRRLAARLEIADLVEFVGYVTEDEKRGLLRRAWANLFVSPKEGWGITNIEAAACGTPSIASDAPGLRESVVHARTGLLVPHGDIEALAGAIHEFARDAARVERLGRHAREFATAFSWDTVADQTEAHLQEVLASYRNRVSRVEPVLARPTPEPGHGSADR